MTMLAHTEIRLKPSVIATIWLIVNYEHHDLCVTESNIYTQGAKASEKSSNFVDCRVFIALLFLQSLYGSTSFINPKTDITHKLIVCSVLRTYVNWIAFEQSSTLMYHFNFVLLWMFSWRWTSFWNILDLQNGLLEWKRFGKTCPRLQFSTKKLVPIRKITFWLSKHFEKH